MAIAVSPTPQPHTRRRATIVVGLAVLVVVVIVSAGMLINHLLMPASSIQRQHFPGQPMHDALGLFTATTPLGWKVTGGRTYGSSVGTSSTGPVPLTTEDYKFHDQQVGDTSATVDILVTAINNPLVRTNACRPQPSADITVDGLPVYVNAPDGLRFDSGNADFQVMITIPLKPEYGGSLNNPVTPIPAVTNPASAQAQAKAILNSIQVTNHHSLCE
jgi:hypothetical protein